MSKSIQLVAVIAAVAFVVALMIGLVPDAPMDQLATASIVLE